MTADEKLGPRELAQQALVAKLAADHLAAIGKQAKADLEPMMEAFGARTTDVLAADGQKMGVVSRCGGERKATVSDPAAFLAWVIEYHPGEIVRAVRESFVTAMLDRANKIGEPVDPSGLLIEGITYQETTSYIQARPTSAARQRMADLLGEAAWMRQLPAATIQPTAADPTA